MTRPRRTGAPSVTRGGSFLVAGQLPSFVLGVSSPGRRVERAGACAVHAGAGTHGRDSGRGGGSGLGGLFRFRILLVVVRLRLHLGQFLADKDAGDEQDEHSCGLKECPQRSSDADHHECGDQRSSTGNQAETESP